MKTRRILSFCLAFFLLINTSMVANGMEVDFANQMSDSKSEETSVKVDIPYDAYQYDGHYYKVYSAVKTWDNAEKACEKLGGHLATISSAEEQLFLESIGENKALWIGGYRDDNDLNSWKWITGEKWEYTNWNDGEPNNAYSVVSNENRIAMWPKKWNDLNNRNVYEQNGYICEWDMEDPSWEKMYQYVYEAEDKIDGTGENYYHYSIDTCDESSGDYHIYQIVGYYKPSLIKTVQQMKFDIYKINRDHDNISVVKEKSIIGPYTKIGEKDFKTYLEKYGSKNLAELYARDQKNQFVLSEYFAHEDPNTDFSWYSYDQQSGWYIEAYYLNWAKNNDDIEIWKKRYEDFCGVSSAVEKAASTSVDDLRDLAVDMVIDSMLPKQAQLFVSFAYDMGKKTITMADSYAEITINSELYEDDWYKNEAIHNYKEAVVSHINELDYTYSEENEGDAVQIFMPPILNDESSYKMDEFLYHLPTTKEFMKALLNVEGEMKVLDTNTEQPIVNVTPTNVKALRNGDNVVITWDAEYSNDVTYYIYRFNKKSNSYEFCKTVSDGKNEYIDYQNLDIGKNLYKIYPVYSVGDRYVKNGDTVKCDIPNLYYGYGTEVVEENIVGTGIYKEGEDEYYYENGVRSNITDVKYVDGEWYNLVNGKVTSDMLASNENGWWYIGANGKVDFSVNSVEYGTVDGESAWWHVVDGRVVRDNTVAENAGGWWCIRDGKVDVSYTGVAQNENGWWRIVDGKVDFNCNSVVNSEYGWWYIRNGQIDFGYTGVGRTDEYGWWRIVNGTIDFNCNSIVNSEYGWWLIRNGQIDFSYTGVAQNENGWWYIENGCLNFNFTGLAPNEYGRCGWWYVRDGHLDFGYTGYVYWYGVNYRVQNGQVIF